MITIIDYGSGNVHAYAHIFKKYSIPFTMAKSVDDLKSPEKLILPGVGAFDQVMSGLNNSGMRERLDELVLEKKTPIAGVCVGMQIMSDNSDEGDLDGLGWIPGTVKKIDATSIQHKPKLPHMGWNDISFDENINIFSNIDPIKGFYFLHTYHYVCTNKEHEIAHVNYGNKLTCAINKDNIYGFQFHPEKSHMNGVTLIRNFAAAA